MRIGLDVMGGDYAPQEAIKGVVLSRKELSTDVELVLIGQEEKIKALLAKEGGSPNDYTIVHAPDVIEMGEHPTKAVSKKPQSSIVTGFKLLKEKKIDAFASAGNTGAMLVGAMYTVKTIPGIIRPTISSILPKENGAEGIILDVGVNSDCKPDNLFQFAILGSLYVKHIYKVDNPRVALLNIGEEEGKGNLLTQATYEIMKGSEKLNFIGNIEGRSLFEDKADVVVCDGFTGNIVLKQAESFFELLQKRKIKDDYFERFNYENYGGTPILGANAPIVIGHGISNATAFKNMILLSRNLVKTNLIDIYKETFN